jgi:hypothetical protein
MAGWEEVVFKGSNVSDLGLVGVAQGDILVAGATPFTFAVLTKGADGTFLKAGASTLEWAAPSIAKLEDITDVEAYAGNGGKVLAVNVGADDVEWISAGAGDFKADGTVPMTAPLRLVANAGESGMGTVDGSMFYDTTADKVKVYVA